MEDRLRRMSKKCRADYIDVIRQVSHEINTGHRPRPNPPKK